MTIQLLNNETVGKIAAGEVVERPASAVKELLENALDAGATRVAIILAGAGSDLIEVNDDGSGISRDELPLALQRHATSKLTSFDDLDRLHTLGFRGEALPSIAAVSSFEIRSRPYAAGAGARLVVDFGSEPRVETVAAPTGTTVTVRDLFGNVPARRKFLKSPTAESSYAIRVVENYALAYPHVAISLTVDGKALFHTTGDGDHLAAATSVLGSDIGGKLLVVPEIEASLAIAGVSTRGWIAHPVVSRSHRQAIVLFVNGRWIQSRPLSFALEDAFHTLLMVGRHPVAFVDIQVDPATVDVNVHPNKSEIKFSDERTVARTVQRAAHAALSAAPPSAIPPVYFPGSQFSNQGAARDGAAPQLPPGQTQPWPQSGQTGAAVQTPFRNQLPMLRVLGQISGAYIIAEGPEGLYLIDQHAAHERIMYEKILGQVAGTQPDRQPLLDPIVVELSPEELAVLNRSGDELAQIGFDIAPFGPGSVVVRSVPAAVPGGDIPDRLHRILQELLDGGAGDSWLDSVAISAACHTSIRAGQVLSLPEMRELIEQLERTENPRACGHGRPTMLQLSQSDLERQFSRR